MIIPPSNVLKTLIISAFIVLFVGNIRAQRPELRWNIDAFPDREFLPADADSFMVNGGQIVRNYKPGSLYWKTIGDQKVAVRVMEKDHIGASGDFWYVRARLKGDSLTYTGQVFVRFPKDFFKYTRAGKLPNGFKADSDVTLDTMRGNGFSSIIMFWSDVDGSGRKIPAKRLDTARNTAAIGDYSYVQSIPQKGGIYGNRAIYTWPDGGGVRLTEDSWWGITQIVRLNTFDENGKPRRDGYIQAWVANPDHFEGKWTLVGNREGLIFMEEEGAFEIAEYDTPWFQGGGSRKPVPYGYAPVKTVEAYARGWTVWAGRVVPLGTAFDEDGKPLTR